MVQAPFDAQRRCIFSECMVRRRFASEKEKDRVGLRKCIGLWWSEKTPGQDGMRYALFPNSWAVLEDSFRVRVLRAPDLTVVPSQLFAKQTWQRES